jgi:predicted DNA-binding ribbon-helix-helix protein
MNWWKWLREPEPEADFVEMVMEAEGEEPVVWRLERERFEKLEEMARRDGVTVEQELHWAMENFLRKLRHEDN